MRVSCVGEVLFASKIMLSNTETTITGTLARCCQPPGVDSPREPPTGPIIGGSEMEEGKNAINDFCKLQNVKFVSLLFKQVVVH